MNLRKLAYVLPIIAMLGNTVPVYAVKTDEATENMAEESERIATNNTSEKSEDSPSEDIKENSSERLPEDSSSKDIKEEVFGNIPDEVSAGESPTDDLENEVEETKSFVITAFQELPHESAEVSYDDKPSLDTITDALPQTLKVSLGESGEAFFLPVAWECKDDYANTDYDVYDFLPVWDETNYPLSNALDPASDIPHVEVSVNTSKASVFLVSLAHAQSSLDAILKSKDILALVYLCDSYAVKQEPGKNSAGIAVAASGQSVQITGINEDSQKNIWYKVTFDLQGSSYSGYIERDYLAFSDEDLVGLEQKYVSSYLYRTASYSSRAIGEDGVYADIKNFPDSYQNALTSLKKAHPNWIFVKMDTGLDWSSAVANENSNSRSLIHSSANAAWKEKRYDSDANWFYPTNGILAYYMDPRNFLTENHVFQFELLSYNATYHTETAVQGILDGTFMSGSIPGDGRTYSQAFCTIGASLNVSPFHLASRVRQEQGEGKSPLISGVYSGYEGLYNYFNIGATGKSNKEVIENGLSYAKSKGWTSRYLSLNGGSNVISQNYIQKHQDTLYLQKYNVDETSPSGLYNHQYMQNIAAPSSESVNVKKAYASAGSLDKPFVFRIPVYDNMPYTPCVQPSKVKEVTLSHTSLSLKADASAALTAYVDGSKVAASSVTFASDNPNIATVDSNGVVKAVSPGGATITCSMSGASTASLTVTVEKTTPDYTVPSLSKVTYDPARALESIALPAGWTWDSPQTVPTVTNTGYPATYTPSDTTKYHTVKETIALTVLKGTPFYTVPTGLKTAVGNTVASMKLPAGFVWETPAAVLDKEGTVTCNASYNPDTANYNTVTGIAIVVTVTKKTSDCVTHSFGEWEAITAAACTADGKNTHSCLLCGYQESQTAPALGHSYTAAVSKEPTETEEGIRTYTCSLCKDTYTEVIAKLPASHKHSYTSKVTKVTSCTVKGMLTYTCSCKDTYTEDIPPTGHSYSSKVTKEATQTETGIRTYTCSKCKDTYTETIAKLPVSHKHSYTSTTAKAPTCTEKGIKSFTCSCGDTYTEDISKLGHDMSGGKCKRCSYKENQSNSSVSDNHSASGSNSGNSSSESKPDSNTALTGAATVPGTNGITDATTVQPAETADPKAPDKNPSAVRKPESSKPGEGKEEEDGSVTINMKENTVLYEEALSAIRGQDVDVVLNMGNSISWKINGRNIVADEANGIDMGIQVNAGNIPSGILTQAAGSNENNTVIELSLSHDGPFDFSPALVISTAIDNAGRMGNLFYYNPDSRTLEFIEAAKVSETGDIAFTFSHASDYAVVISDDSMEETGIISETAQTDASDSTVPADDGQSNTEGAGHSGKNSVSPTVIVLIIIIIVVFVAIGITVYFLLSRKEIDEEEEIILEDEQEEYMEEFSVPSKGETDEYSEYDSGDFIDDYRESAVNTKKTGKVISIAKKQNFDGEDEFDGFE